jgi:hypothetical protein
MASRGVLLDHPIRISFRKMATDHECVPVVVYSPDDPEIAGGAYVDV